MIVGLIGKNLRDSEQPKLALWVVILVTAMVFAVVHFPFLLLVAGTFGLAII